jgi:xylulokinase
LEDVDAVAVGGQQHGMICLDEDGRVVRDALLWNDTRSAAAADELVTELDGHGAAWATAVGSVPLASFTVTKLRWLAEHEPDHAARTAAVCLPHDWLTWRLRGSNDLSELTSDRSDASGTGYWSPATGDYRPDLIKLAFGRVPRLPRVLGPADQAGAATSGQLLGPGAGDNAAAALGVNATAGDVVVSLGTSGVVSAVSAHPTSDPTGVVAGFADATGGYLPLVCTLNAARVLDSVARILGVSLSDLSDLALSAVPGAEGLVVVPYFDGERTPNRPDATAAVHGLTHANSTPANFARAAIEGLLCGLADGLETLRGEGVAIEHVLLIGGAARSEAVCRVAPSVLGMTVSVPEPAEYVADGAARQAAWVVSGAATAPTWSRGLTRTFEPGPTGGVRERYREVSELTARRPQDTHPRSQ